MTMKQDEKVWMPHGEVIHDEILTTEADWEAAVEAEAEALCRWAAARASVIVVAPLLGTAALMANEVYLINRLANLYEKDLTEGAILGFAGSIGGTVAGSLLATLIPLPFLQIPIAVGVTYGVGKAAQAWLKAGMPSDLSPYMAMCQDWADTAKEQAKVFVDNPMKNIPLGDETKTFVATSGERLSDAIGDMKDKIADALVANKDMFLDTAEVVSERTAVGRQAASESLSDTVAQVADLLDLIKEHVMVAVTNRHDSGETEATCPMESVKDTAFFVAESIASLTEQARGELAEQLAKVSEVLQEVLEVLSEHTKMSAEELQAFAVEKLGTASELLAEAGFVVKERMATVLPETVSQVGESVEDAAYLAKEHLATQCAGVVEALQEVGSGVKEVGEVVGARCAMGLADAKERLQETSTGKKAAVVGVVGAAAILGVVALRLVDVAGQYKAKKGNVTPQDLARLTALAKEAKQVVGKVRRTLVEPKQA